mmetsp:Transcript_1042/g.2459  ORF Transcript_1042/g.2459 Transcript_1042/m.2459 type:complete len:264 (-) Transcript_1042:438-1229(-)
MLQDHCVCMYLYMNIGCVHDAEYVCLDVVFLVVVAISSSRIWGFKCSEACGSISLDGNMIIVHGWMETGCFPSSGSRCRRGCADNQMHDIAEEAVHGRRRLRERCHDGGVGLVDDALVHQVEHGAEQLLFALVGLHVVAKVLVDEGKVVEDGREQEDVRLQLHVERELVQPPGRLDPLLADLGVVVGDGQARQQARQRQVEGDDVRQRRVVLVRADLGQRRNRDGRLVDVAGDLEEAGELLLGGHGVVDAVEDGACQLLRCRR